MTDTPKTPARERPILMSGPLVRESLADKKTQTRRPVKNLRVRLRHEVHSDLPGILPYVSFPASVYAAKFNPHGAVTATADGHELGIKPGEFDFQCPYADGHTYLRKYQDSDRMIWHLQVPEGQRLWVRETTADGRRIYPYDRVIYRADVGPGEEELFRQEDDRFRWTPGIHMPRWACRLVLEVKDVRVERLQAITEEDARAEGVADRAAFEAKWVDIYGRESWDANPWVWCIGFRRIQL